MQWVEGAIGCLGLSKVPPDSQSLRPETPPPLKAALGPWPPRARGGLSCGHLGAQLSPPGTPGDMSFLKSLLSRPCGHSLVTFYLRLLLSSQLPRLVRSSVVTLCIDKEMQTEGEGAPSPPVSSVRGRDPAQGREPRGRPQMCAGISAHISLGFQWWKLASKPGSQDPQPRGVGQVALLPWACFPHLQNGERIPPLDCLTL